MTLHSSYLPLAGSSGAGKSSLVDALMAATVQRTGVVSDFNQKGKHTVPKTAP